MNSDMPMMPMSGMYPPESHPPLPNSALPFETLPDFTPFSNDSFPDQAASRFASPSQQTVNIDQALFEFNNARRMLFRFDAYGAVSNVTFNVSDCFQSRGYRV